MGKKKSFLPSADDIEERRRKNLDSALKKLDRNFIRTEKEVLDLRSKQLLQEQDEIMGYRGAVVRATNQIVQWGSTATEISNIGSGTLQVMGPNGQILVLPGGQTLNLEPGALNWGGIPILTMDAIKPQATCQRCNFSGEEARFTPLNVQQGSTGKSFQCQLCPSCTRDMEDLLKVDKKAFEAEAMILVLAANQDLNVKLK